MTNTSRPRRLPRLRELLGLATGNWLSRGYLAVVAASVPAPLLLPDSVFVPDSLTLTAPLSFLTVALPFGPGTEGGGVVEVLATAYWAVWLLLCAFVNAAVLGALVARSATASSPAARSTRSRPQRIRALLAPAVDNWLARGYLAVVAAALGFFLYAVYLSPDPGFAGIWPLMATAPLSIVALVAVPTEYTSLDWLITLVFSAGVVLSGLVNAVLLGRLAHRLRAREAHPAT